MSRISDTARCFLSFRRIFRRSAEIGYVLDSRLKSAGVTNRRLKEVPATKMAGRRLTKLLLSPKVGLPSDAGYTLVETLVAMAIFLSVIIPMGSILANKLLQDENSLIATALHLGQSEITRTEKDASSTEVELTMDLFKIKKTIVHSGDLTDVTVNVSHSSAPKKSLVVLHKTFLVNR